MLIRLIAILAAACVAAGAARAQSPDTILLNGKIVTLDAKSSVVQALAIRDGRVVAVGPNDEVKKLAGPNTRTVDVAGRTVIPGLIDSHIHALRAGLTYSVELSWIGVPSLAKGLELIREAARNSRPGTWIKIGGGKAEKDAAGNLTGVITGNNRTFNFLTDKIPGPTFQDQVEGTKRYFRELNRLGMTGVNDVTGGGLYPIHYRPVQTLWRQNAMTVRVAFHFQSNRRSKELEDFKDFAQFTPQGFGDDWLRFRGIGEALTQGMYDGSTVGLIFNPTDKDKDEFCEAAKWAAEQGMTVHQHAATNNAAAMILDCFEKVNKEIPITDLRWQITHIEDATDETLARMKALRMGWSVQDRLLYAGHIFLKVLGPEAAKRAPPIQRGLKMGLMVGAGTDSDQVAPYNPFVSLRWLRDDKVIDGTPMRTPEQTPGREEALRMYSINAAWFSFDEDKRGSLEVGKYADLAVLSDDYMTVPVEKVGEITSLLTLVGGKAVYGAGVLAAQEGKL